MLHHKPVLWIISQQKSIVDQCPYIHIQISAQFVKEVKNIRLYTSSIMMFVISLMFNMFPSSGVDVIALLESAGISEKVISPLRDSSAGYIALAYALYKIATPVRYTITLGTLS
jgi:hypothetical protein